MKTEILEKTIFNQAVKITELQILLEEEIERVNQYRKWWQDQEKTSTKYLLERDEEREHNKKLQLEIEEKSNQIHEQIKKLEKFDNLLLQEQTESEDLRTQLQETEHQVRTLQEMNDQLLKQNRKMSKQLGITDEEL